MSTSKDLRVSRIFPEALVGVLVVAAAYVLVTQSSIPAFTSSLLIGTPTPTAVPTPTYAPSNGMIYLKLPMEGIASLESFGGITFSATGVPAQLIIVAKKSVTMESGSVIAQHVSEQFCVEVAAFLEKDGLWLAGYDEKNAKFVLVALKTSDLARYGEAAPDKVQLYLVPDLNCSDK